MKNYIGKYVDLNGDILVVHKREEDSLVYTWYDRKMRRLDGRWPSTCVISAFRWNNYKRIGFKEYYNKVI